MPLQGRAALQMPWELPSKEDDQLGEALLGADYNPARRSVWLDHARSRRLQRQHGHPARLVPGHTDPLGRAEDNRSPFQTTPLTNTARHAALVGKDQMLHRMLAAGGGADWWPGLVARTTADCAQSIR